MYNSASGDFPVVAQALNDQGVQTKMAQILQSAQWLYHQVFSRVEHLDGVASLLLRLILAPVLIGAGWTKINGIEFAAIYMAMLIALIIIGGGRYLSLDYYLKFALRRQGP